MSVYQQLVSVVGAQLREDGFASPSHAGLLVKPLSGPWRAWISVPGDTFTLDPMAGIMNAHLGRSLAITMRYFLVRRFNGYTGRGS